MYRMIPLRQKQKLQIFVIEMFYGKPKMLWKKRKIYLRKILYQSSSQDIVAQLHLDSAAINELEMPEIHRFTANQWRVFLGGVFFSETV